jgi:UDP-N-acetylglucosamine--N-acetylmuramyl-(pentapeptide) pyrophosphoryl-undecaprenol N-acetylglucosamine transferase
MMRAGFAVMRGALQARALYREIGPQVVVGFGGYPSAPALVAAVMDKRPTVIHEQNAVMGRANRMLAPHVKTVACAFPTLKKAPANVVDRAHVVGNPVRPLIRALAEVPYVPPEPNGPVRLLVTGGSQGARLLSELVPEAVKALPEDLRKRLVVQQQTRAESMNTARRAYRDALVDAEIAPFFRDIASRLRDAHLVIGRSGAGSVCEFAVAGKPAILVPLAIAIDDDQGQNALLLVDAGGAEIARESQLTVESLALALATLLNNPARLARMAAASRSVAIPDAAEKLADVVERTAATAA